MRISTFDEKALEAKAKSIRRIIVGITNKSKSSHIGSMFSCLDLIIYLYFRAMRFDAQQLDDPLRDRFILSKGHAALALYAVLAEKGAITDEDLHSYYLNGGKLIGHVDHKVPGVEVSSGSLGHGLAIAAGIALAHKLDGRDARTFCLLGDGECNEGSSWESLMFISRIGLPGLIIIIDHNGLQGYDRADELLKIEVLKKMLQALDLNFYELDGHDFAAMEETFGKISSSDDGRAHLILANTIKGKGVSFMEDRLEWHYKSPSEEQAHQALEGLR